MTFQSSTSHETELAARRSRGLFRDAVRRLFASWNGRVGLAVVGFVVLVAIGAPIFSPSDPTTWPRRGRGHPGNIPSAPTGWAAI